jgi:hypothetical protein
VVLPYEDNGVTMFGIDIKSIANKKIDGLSNLQIVEGMGIASIELAKNGHTDIANSLSALSPEVIKKIAKKLVEHFV